MKIFTIIAACMFIATVAAGQPDEEPSQYLFPGFVRGTVRFKSGAGEQTMLNYNMLTQEIVFLQNNLPLALDQVTLVDTVFIKDRKFIPGEKGFFEVAVSLPVGLLVRYSGKLLSPGKPAGYGSVSETNSITSLSSVSGNITYALKLPYDYKVVTSKEFFIKKGTVITKLTNLKQVIKAFAGKEKTISEYAGRHHINFTSLPDLTALIVFCNS